MKKLFKLNLILTVITIILYATVYLGMLFSMVLGFAQVLMSIFIIINFQSLTQITKALFLIYLIPTCTILILIILDKYGDLDSMLEIIAIPMSLALLHLYITYRIKIDT